MNNHGLQRIIDIMLERKSPTDRFEAHKYLKGTLGAYVNNEDLITRGVNHYFESRV